MVKQSRIALKAKKEMSKAKPAPVVEPVKEAPVVEQPRKGLMARGNM